MITPRFISETEFREQRNFIYPTALMRRSDGTYNLMVLDGGGVLRDLDCRVQLSTVSNDPDVRLAQVFASEVIIDLGYSFTTDSFGNVLGIDLAISAISDENESWEFTVHFSPVTNPVGGMRIISENGRLRLIPANTDVGGTMLRWEDQDRQQLMNAVTEQLLTYVRGAFTGIEEDDEQKNNGASKSHRKRE